MAAPMVACSPFVLNPARMSALPSPQDQELITGLLRMPARIAPKYFYDTRGSELFEDITALPEYYPTRTEAQIMERHGAAIARALGDERVVIELGAGNCAKGLALCRLLTPARYVAVDIAADFLENAAAQLAAALPGLAVDTVVADLGSAWHLPVQIPKEKRLLFYPGSSIGNFEPQVASSLLQHWCSLLTDDGAALIGVDLVKDEAILEAAYDDAAGVTAAFNLNVLRHVNRLIGSNFNPADWQHQAFYARALHRIEMHLQARHQVSVRWPGGGRSFDAGERIHTESSYKYTTASFCSLLREAGFTRQSVWTDALGWFAVVLGQP